MAKKEEKKEIKKETKKTAVPKAGPKAGPKKRTKAKAEAAKKTKGKKQVANPPRDPRSKKYQKLVKDNDVSVKYPLAEAAALVLKTSTTKFKSSVELHLNLSNEIRGSVQLPKPTGKKRVVAEADDKTIAELEKGNVNFDVLLATPAQMPKIAKFARSLGPKGLMPNPKSGTVTEDIAGVRKELESGKVEYRTDDGKNIHMVVGQTSSNAEEIVANVQAVIDALVSTKIKSITLSTTMGPGIKVKLVE